MYQVCVEMKALITRLRGFVSGPGAYKTETAMTDVKCTTNNVTKSTTDRYAVLQRRVEELERLHSEGKKSVSALAGHSAIPSGY